MEWKEEAKKHYNRVDVLGATTSYPELNYTVGIIPRIPCVPSYILLTLITFSLITSVAIKLFLRGIDKSRLGG